MPYLLHSILRQGRLVVAGEAVEIARGGGFCGAVGRAVAKIRMIRHEDNPKIEPSAGPPARCAKRAIHYPVRTLPRRTFMGVFLARAGRASITTTCGRSSHRVRTAATRFGDSYRNVCRKILPSGLPSPNCDRFVFNSL